jgi:hypothetical protein
MRLHKLLSILAIPIFLFTSCKKDKDDDPIPTPPPVKETNLVININYNVDGQNIIYDSLRYFNEAGNNYSISKLQFYLSGFKFIKDDGSDFVTNNVFYVDIRVAGTNTLTFKNFPAGNYTGMEFYVGLDSTHNLTNALPNTIENVNMAWPEPMGGGYHFMKLEGHFVSGASTFGYAMHIGLNPYLVEAGANKAFTVTKDINNNVSLNMNINEWYKNPFIYDFDIDGNYSMGNMQAMTKLAANGKDVFNEQ